MTARGAFAGFLLTTALLACSASSAAASPSPAPALFADVSRLDGDLALLGQKSSSPRPSPGPTVFEIKFANHDGYTILVAAFEQTVTLSVIRRNGAQRPSTTTYLARGKVTPGGIEASFADRGEIALRFQPSGRELRATRGAGCTRSSHRVLAHLGLFVGKLRFRGEDGYTSVEVHRVRGGEVNVRGLARCVRGAQPFARDALRPHSPRPFGPLPLELGSEASGTASGAPGARTQPSHRPKRTILFAEDKLPLSRTLFGVRVREGGDARFIAADARSEGRIGILRLVEVTAPASAFAFSNSLASARVEPPQPFSGEAVFQHGSGGTKSWSGSLTVSFLGAPRVPLTGSQFTTRLTQSW
jgi:hypothetical protein